MATAHRPWSGSASSRGLRRLGVLSRHRHRLLRPSRLRGPTATRRDRHHPQGPKLPLLAIRVLGSGRCVPERLLRAGSGRLVAPSSDSSLDMITRETWSLPGLVSVILGLWVMRRMVPVPCLLPGSAASRLTRARHDVPPAVGSPRLSPGASMDVGLALGPVERVLTHRWLGACHLHHLPDWLVRRRRWSNARVAACPRRMYLAGAIAPLIGTETTHRR